MNYLGGEKVTRTFLKSAAPGIPLAAISWYFTRDSPNSYISSIAPQLILAAYAGKASIDTYRQMKGRKLTWREAVTAYATGAFLGAAAYECVEMANRIPVLNEMLPDGMQGGFPSQGRFLDIPATAAIDTAVLCATPKIRNAARAVKSIVKRGRNRGKT